MSFMGVILENGQSSVSLSTCSLVVTFTNLAGLAVILRYYAVYSRRTFLSLSSLLGFLSMSSLALYLHKIDDAPQIFHIVPFITISLFSFGFCVGWGPLPHLFLGEGLPLRIRGPAAGFITGVSWMANFVFVKSFIPLTGQFGYVKVLMGHAVVCGVGGLVLGQLYPEVTGKTDIELMGYYSSMYCNGKTKNAKKFK